MKKKLLWLILVIFLMAMPIVLAQYDAYLSPLYFWARTGSIDVLFFKAVIAVFAWVAIAYGLTPAIGRGFGAGIGFLVGMAAFRYLSNDWMLYLTSESLIGFLILVLGAVVVWLVLRRIFPLRQSSFNIIPYIIVYGGVWLLFSRMAPNFMWSNPFLVRLSELVSYGYYWHRNIVIGALVVFVILYFWWSSSHRRNAEIGEV